MTLLGRKALGVTEIGQTWSFRGSKSRNKVSVGEPAEGSLQIHPVSPETMLKHSLGTDVRTHDLLHRSRRSRSAKPLD
jgi:hypothetical protein